jgi:hypothetical protein
MEDLKKAYDEILKVLYKHREVCLFDVDELERKAKIHLYGVELKERYGLDIKPKEVKSLDYNKFGEYKSICWFGEKYNRTISWSVDGRQPEDEMLFTFSFPTGAYIFGCSGFLDKDYPVAFFKKFWLELKTYNPDYVDEANKALYWKIENASKMFNDFDSILKKYYKLNEEDIKQRKIQKMKDDLAKLEGQVNSKQ